MLLISKWTFFNRLTLLHYIHLNTNMSQVLFGNYGQDKENADSSTFLADGPFTVSNLEACSFGNSKNNSEW